MAVTKLSYTKSKAGIKASLRYYVHRFEEIGERITREIFGRDGKLTKREAYRIIDKAEKGIRFERMILSPDSKTEDQGRRLNMREVTEKTMKALQKILNAQEPLDYLGIEHSNTKNRHVHAIFLIKGQISKKQLSQIRQVATLAAMTDEQKAAYHKQEYQKQLGYISRADKRRMGRYGNLRLEHPKSYRSVKTISPDPRCPLCLGSMTGSGRLWQCPSCGLAVGRKRGNRLQVQKRQTRELFMQRSYERGY